MLFSKHGVHRCNSEEQDLCHMINNNFYVDYKINLYDNDITISDTLSLKFIEDNVIILRSNLDKTGICAICKSFCVGLKLHFLGCLNNVLDKYIQSYIDGSYVFLRANKNDNLLNKLPFNVCEKDDFHTFFDDKELIVKSFQSAIDKMVYFTKNNRFSFTYLNVNGLENKLSDLSAMIEMKMFSIIFISETKLGSNISFSFF